MWGIPSLALDICSLCQLLEERPKSASSSSSSASSSSASSSVRLASVSTAARRRASGSVRAQKRLHHHHHQQQRHNPQQQELELDADTIVIGNGPAGIALSALLSGWQPFYNRDNPHPDPHLHAQLVRMADNAGADATEQQGSLLGQDLGSLADQHFAHSETAASAGGHTPFAVLYDCLVRPHLTFDGAAGNAVDEDVQLVADNNDGMQRSSSPRPSSSASCLCWRRHRSAAVSHIVLGDQDIGGSWTEYDDDMVTVSAAEWMDLPGFAMAGDFACDPRLAKQRPRAGLYKAYLRAYVTAMGLQHNFRPFTRVTQIEKLYHPLTGECHWLLRGTETEQKTAQKRTFALQCRHIVLACGRQQPKLLGVPGEEASTVDGRVVYSLSSLKQRLGTDDAKTAAPATEVSGDWPVVVVGDGISAADAVLHCLSIEQPVLHIVRRTERELRNTQLSRLSSTVYPEYALVYRLMTGRTREVNYRRLLGTSVRSIGTASASSAVTSSIGIASASSSAVVSSVVVGTCGGVPPHLVLSLSSSSTNGAQQQQQQLREQPFRALAVCIGRRSELPLLKEYLHNGDDLSSEFTTRYRSVTDPSLFAIGAMAGDHFVRFLVGGALCVAQTIINEGWQRRRQQQQQQVQAVLPAMASGLMQPPSSGAYLAKAKFWANKTVLLPATTNDDDDQLPWHGLAADDDDDDDRCDANGCRPRDIGADCALLRQRTASATAAAGNAVVSPTATLVSSASAAATVLRAKQYINRVKAQLQQQLSRTTTATTTAPAATVVV